MVYSLMLFATRIVEIMFFAGLAGCASVIFISWISIFKDGFSDLRNRDGDSQWEFQHNAPAESRTASASLV